LAQEGWLATSVNAVQKSCLQCLEFTLDFSRTMTTPP